MAGRPKKPRQSAGKRQKGELAAKFNRRSVKASEVELKFLVSDDNRAIFEDIEKYFTDQGWIKLSRKNSHLLTRQLDTPDRALLKKGVTLRVRGDCRNGSLDEVPHPDICVKAGKSKDKSGAIRRGEYEARIADFNVADFSALRTKYPAAEYPELHDSLAGFDSGDVGEHFRIDCKRDRYVIEVPEKITGVKGKRCVAELILDDVAFVFDIPGLKRPLVFYHDLEVECELLFKACDYDDHPDKDKYVSSPMTRAEADRAMSAIKKHIEASAKGILTVNYCSKAERGFTERDAALKALDEHVVEADGKAIKNGGRLSSIFRLSADKNDEKLHHRLPRDWGAILRRRNIATKPDPKPES